MIKLLSYGNIKALTCGGIKILQGDKVSFSLKDGSEIETYLTGIKSSIKGVILELGSKDGSYRNVPLSDIFYATLIHRGTYRVAV